MATEITFRRGSNDPTSGSGITLAEPVFNTNLHTFHIGLGYGVTAEWVGAPISGLSADIAAGITYKIPTLAAVKNYVTGTSITNYVSSFNGATGAIQGVSSVNGQTGAVTIASVSNVVSSFNGLTGAVQGVSAAVAGTGISVSGATGSVTITNTGVQSFNGLTGAVQGVSAAVAGTGISVSGTTGSVTITNTGVQSFNGRTGAVTGASLGANTFTGLQTMTLGISAAGGMTLAGTLNTTGDIKFNGTAAKTIRTTQAPLSISGVTSGAALGSSNSILFGVQATDPLKLYSATGVVEVNVDNSINPFTTSIKLFTLDVSETNASVNIAPLTYFTADRTLNIQDASGTIALTSQLMGTVNGSTAATTAVTSFNGLTGAVGGVCAAQANTFTALQTFTTGISAAGATFSGDIAVNGGDITTTSANATVFDTTATTLSIGSAATSWTVGATSGYAYIRNPNLVFGNAEGGNNSISTIAGTNNNLYLQPYGSVAIIPTTNAPSIGSFPSLYLNNVSAAAGIVSISGGDLYLGTKTTNDEDSLPVNIIFEGANNEDPPQRTTLTVVDPTANRTITLPDASGTVALTSSTVASFNGTTGAVTGVSRVNGLSGGITFAAGTGITFTTSGNTITVASAPNSTTQTLDFSENTNGLEIVFAGTGDILLTALPYVENNKIIVATIDSGGDFWSCVLDSIQSFYDPTNPNGWAARLVAKPPFMLGELSHTAEQMIADGINGVNLSLTSFADVTTSDVWLQIDSANIYHQDATYVTKTVTGQTWVTANSYIECKVLGLTTADHTPEDAILEGVKFEINNIVAGTGFDIIGHAPEGTYGKYTVKCLGQ